MAIGRLDMIAGEVAGPGGEVARVMWGSDYGVPEEHRGTMMGVSLLMQMQRSAGGSGAIGAHGPSAVASQVYEKMKWVRLPMRRLIWMRRSGSVVRRYVGAGPVAGAARAAADIGLAAHGVAMSAVAGRLGRGLAVEVAGRVPGEWDGLIEREMARVAAGGRAMGRRSSAVLNWWLGNSFWASAGARARNRNAVMLVRDAAGRPAGYAMIKARHYEHATHRRLPDLLLGSVQDWMGFGGGVGSLALIVLAARELARMGVDAVEVCVDAAGEDAGAAGALRRMGFLGVGEFCSFLRPTRGAWLAGERFATSAGWRLRPADGDNFFT
jgi:hypothetical protein